jgi:hypothetical protein
MSNESLSNLIKTRELIAWNRLILYTQTLGQDSDVVRTARTEWSTVSLLLMEAGLDPLVKGREFEHR